MAAIASTAVSLYPPPVAGIALKAQAEWLPDKGQPTVLTKRVKITGVTAADTITPAALGFKTIMDAKGLGYFNSSMLVLPLIVDPTANSDTGGIIIGAGPSNHTCYLLVTGSR